MSKQRIAELHDALDKYTGRADLVPPSLQTPEERRARIKELSIIHLASMTPDEYAAFLASVKAARDGDAAAAAQLDAAKAEGLRNKVQAEQSKPERPDDDAGAAVVY